MNNERAMISGKKILTRVLGIVLSLVLIMSELPAMGAKEVQAATKGNTREKSGKEVYESLESMNEKQPSLYKKDVDPYGNGVDVPFTLTTHDRLALWATCYNGSKSFTSYDLKASVDSKNTGKVLDKAQVNINYSLSDELKKLNYVQTIAFDPTGSGSKDHIAVIGVRSSNNTKAKLYLYVCDKNNRWSSAFELGTVNWMTNALAQIQMVQHAKNFFSITAGDYDNDHKDTLVVYAAYDGTDKNSYGLNEITVNADLSMSKKQSSHTTFLTHNIYNQKVGNLFANGLNYTGNRLSGAVASGDVTGDGIDDLVVLTYVNIMSESNQGLKQITDMYRPYVAVSYGKQNYSGDISAKRDKEIGVWTNDGEWHSSFAPGLSIGNVDNTDGKATKEIIVAGVHNSMSGGASNKVIDPYRITPDKFYISVYNGSLSLISSAVTDSNEWTKKSFHAAPVGDSSILGPELFCLAPQAGVQCFNINGRTNAAYVFVNGNVYAVEKNNLNKKVINFKYTLDSFKKVDNFTDKKDDYTADLTTICFINSIAAGNFDGNADGREQIIYTVGVGQNQLSSFTKFNMGITGAKSYTTAGIAKEYYSTTLNTVRSGYFPSKTDNMVGYLANNADGHDFSNCAMNYAVCAVDNGGDGIVVQYKSKQLLYSDPEVMAVLQAAPYFKDMYEYITDTNSMTYSIEETMSYEQENTRTTSAGIAVCAEASSSVVDASVKAGFETEWSESFTEGFETSAQYKWSSGWLDQVVIRRVPVIAYQYELISNGQPTGQDMAVYFVTAPSYQTVSVKEYNSFVDYYNEQVKASNNYRNASEEKKAKMLLAKLSDNWLGHEGDPAAYLNDNDSPSGLQVLQNQSQRFGMGSGSTGFAWSETTNTGYGESQANGVSFEASVMAGFEFAGNGVKFGVEASLEQMEDQQVTLSKGNGKGIEATIFNIDDNSIAEASNEIFGLYTVAAGYNFDWQVVRWNSNLKDSCGRAVPIYGFRVTGVMSPSPKVDDFKGEIEYVTDNASGTVSPAAISLTWSDPSTTGNTVKEYKIYKRSDDGNSRELISTVQAANYIQTTNGKKEYAYAYALTGEALENTSEFVFTITSVNEDNKEGLESAKVAVVLNGGNKSIVSVEKTETSGNTDIYTIYYTDGSRSHFTVTNGQDGNDGRDGSDGINGRDGADGRDGMDGINGMDGRDGHDGADGRDGKDGVDGKDGKDGKDGVDGKDGKDGKDGVGITGITIVGAGELVFTLSDGTSINVGNILEMLTQYQESLVMKESLMDIMSISAAKKSFSLTWEKIDKADGYEVSYSTYKSMKKAKTVTVDDAGAETAKVEKLTSGKKYYVRVRAYTMVGTGKVYSEWSDKEAVTTK